MSFLKAMSEQPTCQECGKYDFNCQCTDYIRKILDLIASNLACYQIDGFNGDPYIVDIQVMDQSIENDFYRRKVYLGHYLYSELDKWFKGEIDE